MLLVAFGVAFATLFSAISFNKANAVALAVPSLTAPYDGATFNGSKFLMTWSKVPGAVRYQYQSFHNAALTQERWTEQSIINTKFVETVYDGTFWWRVRAVDSFGNYGQWSSAWKLTINSQSPKLLFSSLSQSLDSNDVLVTGSTQDKDSKLARIYLDGVQRSELVVLTNRSYSSSLREVATGEHVVTIVLATPSGRESAESKVINVVDRTPPKISVSFPVLLNENEVASVNGDVDDDSVRSIKVYINNELFINDAQILSKTFNQAIVGLEVGEYSLYVTAQDLVGNIGSSSVVSFRVLDVTPPLVPTLNFTNLQNNALTNATNATATWNKPSEDTAKYTLRYYTNISGTQNPQENPATIELTAEQWNGVLSEGTGQYTFQVQAIDRAGNASPWSEPFVVNLDITAPDAPALTVTNEKGSLATNALTNLPAITVQWNKPSEDTVKYSYQYWKDIPVSEIDETTPTTFETTTQDWSGQLEGGSGTYYLRVQAIDAAGNASEWSVVFVINLDTIAPVVTINSIASVQTPNNVSITATIDDVSITQATVTINDVLMGTAPVTNGVLTYVVPSPTAGLYTAKIEAVDAAGNSTVATQNFEVTTPPVVINEPEVPVTPGAGTGGEPQAPSQPQNTVENPDTRVINENDTQALVNEETGEVFASDDIAQPQGQRLINGVDGGETESAQEIQGTAVTRGFDWGFGASWWGWVAVAIAAIGGWWIIAAIRRRRKQNE